MRSLSPSGSEGGQTAIKAVFPTLLWGTAILQSSHFLQQFNTQQIAETNA